MSLIPFAPFKRRERRLASVSAGFGEPKHAKPDSSGYFKNLDLLGNAPELALLWGRGDAV